MEQKTIKNAQEATEEKEKNAVSLDDILKGISRQVKDGRYVHVGYISSDVIMELMSLGFIVSRTTGQYKEMLTVIDW